MATLAKSPHRLRRDGPAGGVQGQLLQLRLQRQRAGSYHVDERPGSIALQPHAQLPPARCATQAGSFAGWGSENSQTCAASSALAAFIRLSKDLASSTTVTPAGKSVSTGSSRSSAARGEHGVEPPHHDQAAEAEQRAGPRRHGDFVGFGFVAVDDHPVAAALGFQHGFFDEAARLIVARGSPSPSSRCSPVAGPRPAFASDRPSYRTHPVTFFRRPFPRRGGLDPPHVAAAHGAHHGAGGRRWRR